MINMQNVFSNSSVLITGHTGFKGSWLSVWLKYLGAKVIGISDKVSSEPSHFNEISAIFDEDIRLDIRDLNELKKTITQQEPKFIFHLAAQPIVLDSYKAPYKTFTTNTLGTINLLESLRDFKTECNLVLITSDKVYQNLELSRGYHENDRIGGYDPYSGSKGAAELVIRSYFHSFFSKDHNVKLAIARAGNVVGGGDWSSGRIVPDIIKSWQNSKPLVLRNPLSTRPWQHVLDPLYGYLLLALKLNENDKSVNGEAFNFGPSEDENFNVAEVSDAMVKLLPEFSWKEASQNFESPYESKLLSLNIGKASEFLGWSPMLSFKEVFLLTADWYKSYYSEDQVSMLDITRNQIKYFSEKL